MSWDRRDGTNRRPLPPYWKSLCRRVHARDGNTCQMRGPDCTVTSTQVDHISTSDPNNHSMTNLRAVCATCHSARTKQQAAAGVRAYHARKLRPVGRHPGYK